MKSYLKNSIMSGVLATTATLAYMPTANAACDIDCWLRNTFSTNDFVGDWLRDTFGSFNNEGGGEDRIMESLKIANSIVSDWKPGEKMFDPETLATAKPSCKLPELLDVVNKTKSPEDLIKNCF